MADMPTLYVCHGDNKGGEAAPVRPRAGRAARKGHRVREGDRRAGQPDPVPAQRLARGAASATGKTALPVLKLPDGAVIAPSRAILSWIKQQPVA